MKIIKLKPCLMINIAVRREDEEKLNELLDFAEERWGKTGALFTHVTCSHFDNNKSVSFAFLINRTNLDAKPEVLDEIEMQKGVTLMREDVTLPYGELIPCLRIHIAVRRDDEEKLNDLMDYAEDRWGNTEAHDTYVTGSHYDDNKHGSFAHMINNYENDYEREIPEILEEIEIQNGVTLMREDSPMLYEHMMLKEQVEEHKPL